MVNQDCLLGPLDIGVLHIFLGGVEGGGPKVYFRTEPELVLYNITNDVIICLV